jgi:hypothetical protein
MLQSHQPIPWQPPSILNGSNLTTEESRHTPVRKTSTSPGTFTPIIPHNQYKRYEQETSSTCEEEQDITRHKLHNR